MLTGRRVVLREPVQQDLAALLEILSMSDAGSFGLDEPVTEFAAQTLIDRAAQERAAGVSLTYAVSAVATGGVIGLFYVRQLDPGFEAAEWECAFAPLSRGTGAFIESARLVGSFLFGTIGAHRIEARVPVQNGRGNGAMRKLGAVQEGLLRRAARRGDLYVDQVLWSLLKDDWGDHWVTTAARVH